MDANVRKAVIQSLTNAQIAIQANMEEKGVNASGRTSKSLRVEDRGKSIVLVIGGDPGIFGRTAPLETLEIGSDKGARGKWFKSVIYHWAKEKGLSFENDSHRWAWSTIVARKIEESGTARHRNPIVVYSDLVEQTKTEIQSIIAQNLKTLIHSIIK